MRLDKIIESLQNSLATTDKAIFRIGVNTEEKKKKGLLVPVDFEFHIYVVFEDGYLSEVSIYEIAHICRASNDYWSSSDNIVKNYDNGLRWLCYENHILKEGIGLKINKIEDIEKDLDLTYNKIYDKHKKDCLREKKESFVIDNLNVDVLYEALNYSDIDKI